MIRARGLSYGPGDALLSDVSFAVAPGESIVIAGEPDTARAALLRILAPLVRPSSGTLTIAGADAIADTIRARARVAFADAACAAGVGLTVSEFLRWVRQSRKVQAPGDAANPVKEALGQSGIRPDARIDALAPAARATVSLAGALARRRRRGHPAGRFRARRLPADRRHRAVLADHARGQGVRRAGRPGARHL